MDNQGKWLVDEYNIWNDSYDIYINTEHGKSRIAEVFDNKTPNAKLIASSPLLLEACEEALRWFKENNMWANDERDLMIPGKLESAIKKARE